MLLVAVLRSRYFAVVTPVLLLAAPSTATFHAAQVGIGPPLEGWLPAGGAAGVPRCGFETTAMPAELGSAVQALVVVAAAVPRDGLLAVGAGLGRARLELLPHQRTEAAIRLQVIVISRVVV